jgi:hypothetical protein
MPVIYHACLELILDFADTSVGSWLRPRPLFLNVSSFSSLSRGTGVHMGIYHISYLASEKVPNLPIHMVCLLQVLHP